MNKKVSIIIAVLVILAGIYWISMRSSTSSNPVSTSGSSNSLTPNITVTQKGPVGIAHGPEGDFLVDKNGMTLYIKGADAKQTGTDIKPSCNADCEKNWPPLLLSDSGPGITKSDDALLSKINLFKRADGKYQYALGNQPLYTYVNDVKVGDMKGQVVADWTVAKP